MPDLDLLAEIADDPQAERIAAVLADCGRVQHDSTADEGTHDPECWRVHAGCLAARIRTTLTGEDPQ